jgi:uncharacterized RDD family membrane protein YckC
MEKAGFLVRLVAYIIDVIILAIVDGIIQAIFVAPAMNPNAGGGAAALAAIGYILVLIWTFGYLIFFWTSSGATPGKMIMGLKVVTVEGGKLTIGKAVLRIIGYFVSAIIVYLGFLWVIWDKDKQGWHDKIAGTYVVKA